MCRIVLSLILLTVAVAGCAGGASSTSSAASATMCKLPDAGVGATGVRLTIVDCKNASGIECSCVSDKLACEGCGASEGFTCTSTKCTANEYAISLGSSGPSSTTAPDPPAACRFVAAVPGLGGEWYCCPCL
jgi:hypothetical protein